MPICLPRNRSHGIAVRLSLETLHVRSLREDGRRQPIPSTGRYHRGFPGAHGSSYPNRCGRRIAVAMNEDRIAVDFCRWFNPACLVHQSWGPPPATPSPITSTPQPTALRFLVWIHAHPRTVIRRLFLRQSCAQQLRSLVGTRDDSLNSSFPNPVLHPTIWIPEKHVREQNIDLLAHGTNSMRRAIQ